jgi:hypothetical protein
MLAHGLTLRSATWHFCFLGRYGATIISKNREHIIDGLHMHTHNGVTGPLIAIKLSSIAVHRIYGHLMMVCVNYNTVHQRCGRNDLKTERAQRVNPTRL